MPKVFNSDEIPDLTGKVAIVTGGAGSIGLETVFLLARKNATVYIAGRSAKKAAAAIQEIKSRFDGTSGRDVRFLELDLMSMKGSVSAAKSFLADNDRLDIIVANAACALSVDTLSEEGYENTFQTNHLGHFAFITTLLPLVESTAEKHGDARIVVVSSLAYALASDLNLECVTKAQAGGLRSFPSAWKRYADSKLSNILFAREMDRRLREKGVVDVRVNVCYPGMIAKTGLGGTGTNFAIPSFVVSAIRGSMDLFGLSAREGAMTQTYLATMPVVKENDVHGVFYIPQLTWTLGFQSCKESELATKTAKDDGLAKKLWEFTEKALERAVGEE